MTSDAIHDSPSRRTPLRTLLMLAAGLGMALLLTLLASQSDSLRSGPPPAPAPALGEEIEAVDTAAVTDGGGGAPGRSRRRARLVVLVPSVSEETEQREALRRVVRLLRSMPTCIKGCRQRADVSKDVALVFAVDAGVPVADSSTGEPRPPSRQLAREIRGGDVLPVFRQPSQPDEPPVEVLLLHSLKSVLRLFVFDYVLIADESRVFVDVGAALASLPAAPQDGEAERRSLWWGNFVPAEQLMPEDTEWERTRSLWGTTPLPLGPTLMSRPLLRRILDNAQPGGDGGAVMGVADGPVPGLSKINVALSAWAGGVSMRRQRDTRFLTGGVCAADALAVSQLPPSSLLKLFHDPLAKCGRVCKCGQPVVDGHSATDSVVADIVAEAARFPPEEEEEREGGYGAEGGEETEGGAHANSTAGRAGDSGNSGRGGASVCKAAMETEEWPLGDDTPDDVVQCSPAADAEAASQAAQRADGEAQERVGRLLRSLRQAGVPAVLTGPTLAGWSRTCGLAGGGLVESDASVHLAVPLDAVRSLGCVFRVVREAGFAVRAQWGMAERHGLALWLVSGEVEVMMSTMYAGRNGLVGTGWEGAVCKAVEAADAATQPKRRCDGGVVMEWRVQRQKFRWARLGAGETTELVLVPQDVGKWLRELYGDVDPVAFRWHWGRTPPSARRMGRADNVLGTSVRLEDGCGCA